MNTPEPSRGRLVIALLLAVAGAAGLWLLWRPALNADRHAPAASAQPAPAQSAPMLAAAPTPPAPARPPSAPLPEGDADPTPDLSSYVARGEKPTMGQVIERLHQRGIYTGLGAFSPPGTSPPLAGLAVPPDYVLPKGYVRHHQTTDDGQPIEPILMFAPDFQLLDASSRPLAMPADRVVPPDMAPPGLPIRRIVIPPPIEGRL